MLIFLLKASLIIVILLAFYKLFLEKESFFAVNRVYLLLCLLLAVALPFLSLPKLVEHQGYLVHWVAEKEQMMPEEERIAIAIPPEQAERIEEVVEAENKMLDVKEEAKIDQELEKEKPAVSEQKYLVENTTIETALPATVPKEKEATAYGFVDWLFWMYLFGVVILFINLIAQILNTLRKAVQNEDKVATETATIINLENESEPCSFFRYIFIHPDSYDFETYEQILAHEQIHVQQGHSIDLLLAEIAVVLFWFNPFIWWFRKEVEKNIEYQTDALLTQQAKREEKKDYQLNLLKIATYNKPLTITTNYNQSLIKQRILKMNTKKSNPYSYWKYAFIVPIVFLTLLAMNEPYDATTESLSFNNQYAEVLDISIDTLVTQDRIIDQLIQDGIVEEPDEDIYFFVIDESVQTNGQIIAGADYLKYKDLLELQGVDIKPYWGFYSSKNGGDFQGQSNKLIVEHLIEFYNRQQKERSTKAQTSVSEKGDDLKQLHQVVEALRQRLKADKVVKIDDITFEYKKGKVVINGQKLSDQQAQSYLQFLKKRGVTIVGNSFKLRILPGKEHWRVSGEIDFDPVGDKASSRTDNSDFKNLMLAIENDDLETVQAYLDQGIDIYQADENGFTPLLLAAYKKHGAIAKAITAKTIEQNDFHIDFDFHQDDLLTAADLDSSDYRDFDLFMEIIENGNWDLVKYFIDKGININGLDHNNFTPLMTAAHDDHPEIARLLIDEGADVNYINSEGWTALIEAADEGAYATAVVLIEAGADVNLHNEHWGRSALTMAASEGYPNIIELLLDAGADLKMLEDGYLPLHSAAEEGQIEALKMLLNKGVEVHLQDHHGRTALMYAAEEGNLEIVKILVEKGIDINETDEEERTALSYGVEEGNRSLVRYLLEKGADMMLKDQDGKRAIDYAIEEEYEEMVNILLEHKDDYDEDERIETKFEMVNNDNLRLAKRFIQTEADANVSNEEGWTLLMEAADEANFDFVQFLVEKGADVNAQSNMGWTALMEAVDEESLKLVRYLIQQGANTNLKTYSDFTDSGSDHITFTVHRGWTALFEAVDQNTELLAALLIRNGANVNASVSRTVLNDNRTARAKYNNWTVLMEAVEREQPDMVRLLLSNGADAKAKNSRGESVLDVARKTGNVQIINLINNQNPNSSFKNENASDWPEGVTVKIMLTEDQQITVRMNLRREVPLAVEVRKLDGSLLKKLSNGKFKGDFSTTWNASNINKKGTYVLNITVDGESRAIKVGEGTDYPW
ncbi:MAG: ankyrin repeat domain-containing protein [Bacteroidota bacterium]